MKSMKRVTIATLVFLFSAGLAHAQYPAKPVRLVVPFPAGGGADILARNMSGKLGEVLGQTVVVDNRPGAGGNVGAEAVARAAPDGYTLFFGTNGTHAINQSLYRKLAFDPIKDFAPVIHLQSIAAVMIVNPAVPAKTVREFVDYARARPGQLAYASAGNGTTSHLAVELLKTMTGMDLVHVPYKGGAAAMTDLIAGQVPITIDVMANALPQVKAGKVRALGVTPAKRVQAAPEIPTIAESGVPGYEVTAWTGVLVPAGTPPEIVARLNDALNRVLQDPDVRARMLAGGAEPVGGSPGAFGAFIRAETEKWAQVVKASGAQVD